MKVLMISTDRKIFEPDSVVRNRMVRYGSIVSELHIIVLSKQNLHLTDVQLAPNVYAYPTNSLNKLSYAMGAISIGKEICRSREIELISSQDPFETGWLGHHLAKLFNIPLQIQVHTDFLSPHYGAHSFMNRMRVQLGQLLLPHAANIRVVSSRIKQSLIENLSIPDERIRVLPVYVDWETFAAKTNTFAHELMYPQFKKVVLAVGRLESEKRMGVAIDTFLAATEGDADIGLVVLGEGSQKAELVRQVNKSSSPHKVVFAGWQADSSSFYQEADIYLHAAVYEGYGMSIMEAAMAELPIVTTEVGIASDVVANNKNGFTCPVDDLQCLETSLRTVVEELPRFKEQSEKKAKELEVLKSEEDYLIEYKKCLEACL